MFLMDMPALIVLGFALGTALLWLDVLFLKNAVIRAIFHGVSSILETHYGWVLIVALVVVLLMLFAILTRQ